MDIIYLQHLILSFFKLYLLHLFKVETRSLDVVRPAQEFLIWFPSKRHLFQWWSFRKPIFSKKKLINFKYLKKCFQITWVCFDASYLDFDVHGSRGQGWRTHRAPPPPATDHDEGDHDVNDGNPYPACQSSPPSSSPSPSPSPSSGSYLELSTLPIQWRELNQTGVAHLSVFDTFGVVF